ncbi:thioredoxin family protein [Desulfonema magnum]|uniref:Thioredoxin-like fold-containing protein n=1 Tax=Desulfonema magnum TaxID=45655 RepID=A0A975GQ01_9BACT|nr:thioredoxin family protein [Desulfonema magnum]QTA89370.1 Thioredoxin-like fold-containing protein [Desulfonema magnum]
MTPQEEKQIGKWNDKLSEDIQVRVVLTEDERSSGFGDFCEDLSRIAFKIRIIKEQDDSNNLPAIRISDDIEYHAIPLGTELEPFLEAIFMSQKKEISIPEHIREPLSKIRIPALLRLYVSPQCPFCPVTARQLIPLAFANKFVHLTITDGALFPEMAASDDIRAVPAVLLDENFRWTGSVRVEELAEIMASRDPAKLGAASMETMILEGNAFQLAEMMIEKKDIFPAFPDVLVHEQFSVRLGAMAAAEEIADQNKKLAAKIVGPLWRRFQDQRNQIRGDIIHILGETGGYEIVPKLEMILAGQYHEEIKEAAEEAMEKIKQRS